MTRFLAGLLLGLLVGVVLLRYQYKTIIYWKQNFDNAISICESHDDNPDWSSPPALSLIPKYPSTDKSPSVRSEKSDN